MAFAAVTALALTGAAPGAALAHGAPKHPKPNGVAKGHGHKTLYVAPSGSDANACTSQAPCATIGHAVSVAARRRTVVVRAGTYPEQVTIDKRLRLVGTGGPVIDAAGHDNGILIDGRGARHSLVRGFVVEHATFEGILARQTDHVTVRDNTVQDNDLGVQAQSPQGECAPQGEIPGDCGEGIHLMSVRHAKVRGNTVMGNLGGILLTDELGPTAHNAIVANDVHDNLYDCGITIAGHNPGAFVNGHLQRKVAGISHNRIFRNKSNANGTLGEGAGILMATAGPGTAVYANVVKGNTADANGLAGITLHSHAPGDYLNGNRIVGNHVSNDNLGGDPDAGVADRTGILIFSAFTTLRRTVVRANHISDVHFGIWTKNVPAIPAGANHFTNVDVALSQS